MPDKLDMALKFPDSSFFRKFSQNFACFLQIFPNISLAVLSDFRGLAEEKSFFQ